MHLMPVESGFFDLFEKHVERTVESVAVFQELLEDLANAGPKAKRVKEIEHEADVLTHQTVEMLHKTFITPFDRDDIHRLITRMDDVLDAVESAAERTWLYEIAVATPEATAITGVLKKAVEALRPAIKGLRHVKRERDRILEACVDINRLENEVDAMLRQALAKLFREETDALTVMKWKEIYETLEHATDRCEDVANIVEGVVLENA